MPYDDQALPGTYMSPKDPVMVVIVLLMVSPVVVIVVEVEVVIGMEKDSQAVTTAGVFHHLHLQHEQKHLADNPAIVRYTQSVMMEW